MTAITRRATARKMTAMRTMARSMKVRRKAAMWMTARKMTARRTMARSLKARRKAARWMTARKMTAFGSKEDNSKESES